jgi:hypothetical protein
MQEKESNTGCRYRPEYLALGELVSGNSAEPRYRRKQLRSS